MDGARLERATSCL